MQQELVEVTLSEGVTASMAAVRAGGTGGRRVTVNRAESPLSWLRARGLVDARQYEAGERLRADHERACLSPGVTMRWDASGSGSTGAQSDPTTTQIDAKARFDRALKAVGPGLSDILWRVVCANEALPGAEKGLGWPARSGRLVLGLALDRLADAYGLPGSATVNSGKDKGTAQ